MKREKKTERVAPTANDEYNTQLSTTSRNGAALFSATLFIVAAALALGFTWQWLDAWSIVAALITGLIAFMSVHIAYEWERAVIVRLGKFHRVVGPGIYFTIPIVESEAAKIDQRIRTISFDAEETLSSDLVPVNVDTVLFWVVWDVERACKEVRNYEAIISLAAQTAMRDVIGQICLSEIAMRRTYLDEELKRIISEKVDDWGITVVSVEIRDIVIPKELQAAGRASDTRRGGARHIGHVPGCGHDVRPARQGAAAAYDEPGLRQCEGARRHGGGAERLQRGVQRRRERGVGGRQGRPEVVRRLRR